MKRTNIYLEETILNKAKEEGKSTGESVSYIIRAALSSRYADESKMCDLCLNLARKKLDEDTGYVCDMDTLIDFSMSKTYYDWIDRLCKERIDTNKLHFLIAENCNGSFEPYFELTIEWLLNHPKGDIEEYERFIINNRP